MADSETIKTPDQIDALDAMAEHLSKATGILGTIHAASMGDGPLGGDVDIKGAAWAAYDELMAVRAAFVDLQALLPGGV